MLIDGFRRAYSAKLQKYAFRLAKKWIRTNYLMYNRTNSMFEKYDSNELKQGTGGEYIISKGFGWTNGVILDLLRTYNTVP